MLEATHLKTLEETNSPTQSTYYGYQIWDKFEDPYNENWVCCPLHKYPVSPVKKHTRIINEKEITVVSYFRHKSSNICPSSESDEHKRAKILLSSLIESEKIILKIGYSKIDFKDLKYKEVPRLPFRWEQTREKRRADVLFEFEEWHNVLGQGMAFEIQTKPLYEDDKNKRETDWICNGYSLAWLPLDLFSDDSLTNNEIVIDCVWALKFSEIVREFKDQISKLHFQLQKEMEQYEYRRTRTCRSCIHGSIDKNNDSLIACWYGTPWAKSEPAKGTQRHPAKHEQLDTCPQWKSREGIKV